MAKKKVKKTVSDKIGDVALDVATEFRHLWEKGKSDLLTLQLEHEKLQHKLSVLDAIASGDQMKALRLVLDGVKHKVNFQATWVEGDQPKTQTHSYVFVPGTSVWRNAEVRTATSERVSGSVTHAQTVGRGVDRADGLNAVLELEEK